jgi:Uma2 family endonuclease
MLEWRSVRVSDYEVLQPDLVFFGPSRRHLVHPDQAIRSAPDLVVEILSASTERIDRGRKMQAVARFGVPEYWIVDPRAKTVEVYRLAHAGFAQVQKAGEVEVVRSATIPGLEFAAARAFVEWPAGSHAPPARSPIPGTFCMTSSRSGGSVCNPA